MNADVMRLTLRQQLNLGRALIMLILAGLPVLITVVWLAADRARPPDDFEEFTADLQDRVVLLAVLPIVGLLFGTGVMGDEVTGGTLPYLLLKPLNRTGIVLSKIAVGAILTGITVGLSVLTSGLLIAAFMEVEPTPFDGSAEVVQITFGFLAASLIGGLAYCAWFVFLSLLTGRAFIAGLLYVFIWEGVITEIFSSARYLSIRHYTRAIADAAGDPPAEIFDADLSAPAGLIGICLLTAALIWAAKDRLRSFEVRDRGG